MKDPLLLLVARRVPWLSLAAVITPLWAQAPRGSGPAGEWFVKAEFNGRPIESILTFSRGEGGGLTGQSISLWGANDLEDVRFENGELTFKQSLRTPNGETMTSQFKGAIANRQLTGTLSSDRGELTLTGERRPRMSRAVGDWDMTVKMADREFTAKLIVRPGADNTLIAEWQSSWGEHKIADVAFERGTLRFTRTSKIQDREWASTFEGSLERDTLTGTFKSERGEAQAEGKRVGAALIGDWKLELISDRGTRQQRLRINPDLSALYGPTPLEKIRLEDDQVTFNFVRQFGDQSLETKFTGKWAEAKLQGELTSERGTTKVVGTKIVRPRARSQAN